MRWPEGPIRPIETSYKGYRFRSRLEARWAVFFDAIGIKWLYEHEGFDLGEAGWYLPDFWLPEAEWHVEVKAARALITPTEQAKINALDSTVKPGWGVIVLTGTPTAPSSVLSWYEEEDEGARSTGYLVIRAIDRRVEINEIKQAMDAARAARFDGNE